ASVLEAGKIRLIQNGVDVDRFSPSQSSRIPGLVVCVGRLSRQKGQDRLLRALPGVPNAQLVFLGDGPDRRELEDLTNALGLTERVTFEGVQDPLPYLGSAEVVALPSRWEGLSIFMLEAMASGSLIVHTDFGGADVLQGVAIPATGNTE